MSRSGLTYKTEIMDRQYHEPSDQAPFKILILGDFSGSRQMRRARNLTVKNNRSKAPIMRLDKDNFTQVMAYLKPEIALNSGLVSTLTFTELDDFHPDQLLEREPLFQALLQLRGRLADSKHYLSALHDINQLLINTAHEPSKELLNAETLSEEAIKSPDLTQQSDLDSHDTQACDAKDNEQHSDSTGSQGRQSQTPDIELDDVLAVTSERSVDQALEGLVKQTVNPYLQQKQQPEQVELIEWMEQLIAHSLNDILHDHQFQQLESNWRSLYFLVKQLQLNEHLQLYIWDVSKIELATDLLSLDDLNQTDFYRTVLAPSVGTPGGQPWSLLMGCFEFDDTPEDLSLLTVLARLASRSQAPFLAGVKAAMLGQSRPQDFTQNCHEIPGINESRWQDLRKMPQASYLGLVWPRFLLRLPYGPKSSPCGYLEDFQEHPLTKVEHFVWAQSAVAPIYLLAQSYSQSGRLMRPGQLLQLDTTCYYLMPSADEWDSFKLSVDVPLTQSSIEQVDHCGIMSLVAVANSQDLRLMGFRSLALHHRELKGPWNTY